MDLDVCLVGWFCLVVFFSCVNLGIRREASSHLSSQVQLDSNAELVLMETSAFYLPLGMKALQQSPCHTLCVVLLSRKLAAIASYDRLKVFWRALRFPRS